MADQRRRLQGAVLGIALSEGWSKVRVREIVRTAGVSSSSFYKHFANADDCLASAFDSAVSGLLAGLEGATARRVDWQQSLRSTISELLQRFASDPAAARLTLIDGFAAGPVTKKRIGLTAMRVEESLADCFGRAKDQVSVPRHLVAGMTGGILRVLRTTVSTGRTEELPTLIDPLVDWLISLADTDVVSLSSVDTRRATGSGSPRLTNLVSGTPTDERRRLLQTVIRLAAQGGFGGLTAPNVRRDAGVPRRQFDRLFAGVDECFLEAVDALVESVATGSSPPEIGDWTRRSHRTIAALCSSAADNRRLARVAFLEIFAPGRDGLLRREQIIGRGATALRRTVPADERPSPLVAEASVAAAWHVAQADVNAGRTRSLPSVAPLLSYLVLAPIVGAKPAVAAIRAEAQEGELAAA